MHDPLKFLREKGMADIHARVLQKILTTFSPRAREARLRHFVSTMKIQAGQRVIDLGGSPGLWRFVDVPLDITIFNIEKQEKDERCRDSHRFTFMLGDATRATELQDNSFDIVFSNSCIEHVGPPIKQAAFAREVRRLAPSYYVQTPARSFPIEAHTGLPFWWYYPTAVRSRLIERWQARRPAYGEFIGGTRVLRRPELERFFPDAWIDTEKVLGLTKSYTAWRTVQG